jgi:HSP20 family protein
MMDKPRYDPLAELGVVRDMVREMVQHGPFDPRTTPPAALASLLIPLDILDMGASIVIQANLPGVTDDALSIDVRGDTLTLSADVKPDIDMQGGIYLRRERQMTKLTRAITLPVAVEAERAAAAFKNGILTITLPKIAANVPKTIRVRTE